MKKVSRFLVSIFCFVIWICILGALDSAITVKATENEIILKSPTFVSNQFMESKQLVTYDCIYFGTYPQTEIVSEENIEELKLLEDLNKKFSVEYKIISSNMFSEIENGSYDDNGNAIINGIKYKRILKSEEYYYFQYEPIKWRILNLDDKQAFLLSDVILDYAGYMENGLIEGKKYTWDICDIRSWLNGYDSDANINKISYVNNNFIDAAFSDNEKKFINDTLLKNNSNIKYKTNGGNDTTDKIFLLSEDEIYHAEEAVSYGFINSYQICDEAKKSRASMYVKKNIPPEFIHWWLRSPGQNEFYGILVESSGKLYDSSSSMKLLDHGIRPALNLNLLDNPYYEYAGIVATNGSSIDENGNCIHSYILNEEEATCTKTGRKVFTCSICGEEYEEILDKKRHMYDDGKVTKIATCLETGTKTYTCTICGDTYTENIAQTDHLHLEICNVIPATCGTDGYTGDTFCVDCGSKLQSGTLISATEMHIYDLGRITKEASCTDEGIKTYTCTVCGNTYDENIIPTGHQIICLNEKDSTYSNEGYTGDLVCEICSQIIEMGTIIPMKERIEATGKFALVKKFLLEKGQIDDNGNNYFQDTMIVSDNRRNVATISYIDAEAKFKFCCEDISNNRTVTKITMYIDENGSQTVTVDYSEDIISLYASATFNIDSYTENENVFFEKTSANILDDSEIQDYCNAGLRVAFSGWDLVLLKNFGFDVNMADMGFISYEDVGTHTGDGVVTKKPTCTEKGVKTYTCVICGFVRKEAINMTQHQWNKVYTIDKKATNTTVGLKSIHCSICGAVKKGSEQIIPKLAGNVSVNSNNNIKNQTIKSTTSKKISEKKVKKKAQSFKLSAKSTSGIKVQYKLVKKNRNIKFASSSGKVTVKKGTKKGTYKIKVKMTVSENNYYKSYSTIKTITIKVK